jgi:SAM-dependent methyltransferase
VREYYYRVSDPSSAYDARDDRRVRDWKADLETYFSVLEAKGWPRGNARFYMNYLFDGIDLRGKAMVDVGAGDGRFSFYAASAGANRVVSLEPEAHGSTRGVKREFEELGSLLPAHVQLVAEPLQEFQPTAGLFDILFLHASVNHLDEDACTRLQEDQGARRVYHELLTKLATLARPGGKLIVVDAARRNLFGDLGVRNPLAPTIEWEKHQSPELWAALFADVGFSHPRIRWNSFSTLRSFGRVTTGNRLAAYCLNSMFCLTMEATGAPTVTHVD